MVYVLIFSNIKDDIEKLSNQLKFIIQYKITDAMC